MKVAIYGQAFKTDSLQYIINLVALLTRKKCDVSIVKSVYKIIRNELQKDYKTFSKTESIAKDTDFMISVGGDGTMLRAAGIIQGTNIPVIGINTGRMGFLANVHKQEMEEALDLLKAHKFNLDKRSLLEVNINKEGKSTNLGFALNEITVSRKNLTSMITVNTYLNDEFLNTYWADGLIVSTPTGSTGYSLSCNGPIIMPNAETLIITPIAPHNLSIRPLVIRDDARLSLEVSGRESEFLLSLDSKVESLTIDTKVCLKKADFQIGMIELEAHSFLKTLREKLLWGKDTRN
jgi:NAD+ kinase